MERIINMFTIFATKKKHKKKLRVKLFNGFFKYFMKPCYLTSMNYTIISQLKVFFFFFYQLKVITQNL